MSEQGEFVEQALAAADSGNAGHWPTVAGYLADEVRRLRAAIQAHRCDGFTEEQIRLYCECAEGPTPTGPKEDCCLHGRFDFAWQVAYLDDQHRPVLVGHEHRSDEFDRDQGGRDPLREALAEAEKELTYYADDDGRKHFLVRRLLNPWQPPNA